MFLKIDGTTYISNTSWTTPDRLGTDYSGGRDRTSLIARFGNGGGGAGADGQNNNGWTGWTNSIGFIYRVDDNGGTEILWLTAPACLRLQDSG